MCSAYSLKDRIHKRQEDKRKEINPLAFIDAACLPWQKSFILDPHQKKALFGERRGAKSTCMGIAAIDTCLHSPSAKVLYASLTKDSCKKIMYDGVLSYLLRTHNIPAKLVNGNEMRFDNGSIIYLVGLDSTRKEKEKVRGIKSSLNIIDEMQSFQQDTQLIINEIIGPAAADTNSPEIIGGTAGDAIGKNYWYEITKDNTRDNRVNYSLMHPEWKVYRCSWEDNISIDEITGKRVCDNIRKTLEEQKKLHPGIECTSSFRKEWNAEWLLENNIRVYKSEQSNYIDQIPVGLYTTGIVYMLGLDLGYNDPNAFVIVAYNLKFSNKLYVIRSYEKNEMNTQSLAKEIKQLDNQYHFVHMIVDGGGLGKQIVIDLNTTYGLHLEPADKAGKLSHINMLNSDFQTNDIIIYQPDNKTLIDQLSSHRWNRKKFDEGDYVEDDQTENHSCDSLLYIHNYSRHHWYKSPPVLPTQAELHIQKILEGERKLNRQNIITSTSKSKYNAYRRP